MSKGVLIYLFQITNAKKDVDIIRRLTNDIANLVTLARSHTFIYVIFVFFVAKSNHGTGMVERILSIIVSLVTFSASAS